MKHSTSLVVLVCLAIPASAQSNARYMRADGAEVEAKRLDAPGCAPLAIISHGLGGSSEGNAPLAEALNKAGYRVVVPTHAESSRRLLRTAIVSGRGSQAVDDAASDPAAHRARQADFDAILAVEERQCRPPHKILAGHSMGARAVLVHAGATSTAGIRGTDRFDAYIAISPLGEGISFFPKGAVAGLRKPVMIITGTKDRSINSGYESRLSTYESLPPGRKRLAVIDNASHFELGGHGDKRVGRLVGELVVEFTRQIPAATWLPTRRRQGVLIAEK
ncbi:hypothetical protein MCEMSEM23_00698 [Rhabdaerophilaceae bacterium]